MGIVRDTTVKYLDSEMFGAQYMNGLSANGRLITVLDQCLVNGFNQFNLSSISINGDGLAVVTSSGAHNLRMIRSDFGPVLQLSGAGQMSSEWRLEEIISDTEFTVQTTLPAMNISLGGMTAKYAPLGWKKKYSGTNLAAYARTDPLATIPMLRISDTSTNIARSMMYETMSGISTGTNATAEIWTYKSSETNANNRPWRLIGNGRTMYFFINGDWNWAGGIVFGDFQSYVPDDPWACYFSSGPTSSGAGTYLNFGNLTPAAAGNYICRRYDGIGGNITSARYSHFRTSVAGNNGNPTYPTLTTGKVHYWPIEIWDGTSFPRGLAAGCYNPIHLIDDGSLLTLDNGKMAISQMTYGATRRLLIQIEGPWEYV